MRTPFDCPRASRIASRKAKCAEHPANGRMIILSCPHFPQSRNQKQTGLEDLFKEPLVVNAAA